MTYAYWYFGIGLVLALIHSARQALEDELEPGEAFAFVFVWPFVLWAVFWLIVGDWNRRRKADKESEDYRATLERVKRENEEWLAEREENARMANEQILQEQSRKEARHYGPTDVA